MITILLPAYDEELSLPKLLPKIDATLKEQQIAYRIIVCNDGSRDKTKTLLEEYAQNLPIEIIEHKINRGLGESSRDMFERAAEVCEIDDIIIRMDCDDTHEPEFIPKMVEKVQEGYDVVIASRFEPGGGQLGVSAYRAFISRGANLFMKVFFPIKGLKEYSCGFRAYRANKIKQAIDFYGNHFIYHWGI